MVGSRHIRKRIVNIKEVHFCCDFDADYESCPTIACGWDDACQCTLEESKVTCKKCLKWLKKVKTANRYKLKGYI